MRNSEQKKDDITIPISAQMFDFCEDSDIFHDTLQNSEATSSPNCCSYEDQNSPYTTNISFPSNTNNNTKNNKFTSHNSNNIDINNFQGDQNGSATSSTTTTANTIAASKHHHSSGLSVIFDPQVEIDNDISASIDFSTPPLPYSFNPTTLAASQIAISNNLSQFSTSQVDPCVAASLPLMGGPGIVLGPVFEDDCLSSIPPFLRLNHPTAVSSSSSCTFLEPPLMANFPPGSMNPGLCTDNSGLFGGSLLMGGELQGKELDFQGDNGGIFCSDQLVRYNSGDIQGRPNAMALMSWGTGVCECFISFYMLDFSETSNSCCGNRATLFKNELQLIMRLNLLNVKAFSNENSQLVSGATTSNPAEISSLDDSTYKVGKLSAEQRKEKIHRYMKKRNERNFCKKIKYACRKTLADSRPRVRGRFAKNDEFGEGHKHINGHPDEDDYDEVVVKEEDDMVDSADIFAHISGVNSFKCNYQIQSWI